jgi:4'-phosphopantetheinyl transferase
MIEEKGGSEGLVFNYPDSLTWKLENKIHVWKFPLLPVDESSLTDSEMTIARRFRFEPDRSRFATGRRALRFLVSKYLLEDPLTIDIVAQKGEKPFIRHPVTKIRFNISHSGCWVVIALACEELGIDIEKINSSFDYSILLDEYFSNAEQRFIHDAGNPTNAFYSLWTRKEALVKALGRGLLENLKKISVLDGQEFKDIYARIWRIRSFVIPDEYPASLAYFGSPEEICYLDGRLLFS